MIQARSHHHQMQITATNRRHFALDQHLTIVDRRNLNLLTHHPAYIDHSRCPHLFHGATLGARPSGRLGSHFDSEYLLMNS